jgi:hypothetical protein
VTDGILGLIWDFASSGPAVWSPLWRRSASSGPSRFGPGADQGGIKVGACVSHAIQTRSWARRACHKFTLYCTVLYGVLVARANGGPSGVPSKQEHGSRGVEQQGEQEYCIQ